MAIEGTCDQFGNYIPSALDEELHKLSLEEAAKQPDDVDHANYGVRRALYLEGAKAALDWACGISLIHADSDNEVFEAYLEDLESP